MFSARILPRKLNLVVNKLTSGARFCNTIVVDRALTGFRHCSTYDMSHNERAYRKGSVFPPLAPGTLRIYSMRFCPFAQRTRLVLEHKQIPYETVNVNLKHKPDWLFERNPLGLVPVLEHDGKVVFESLVCDDYLEDIYPQTPLRPSDPYLRARDRVLEEMFGKIIDSFYKLMHSGGTDEQAMRRYFKYLGMFEQHLGERGQYFGGSKPSMVDFTIWPWIERSGAIELLNPTLAISKEKFPKIYAWRARMFDLPAVKATMFDTKTHIQFLQSLAAKNPQYDIGLDVVQANL